MSQLDERISALQQQIAEQRKRLAEHEQGRGQMINEKFEALMLSSTCKFPDWFVSASEAVSVFRLCQSGASSSGKFRIGSMDEKLYRDQAAINYFKSHVGKFVRDLYMVATP